MTRDEIVALFIGDKINKSEYIELSEKHGHKRGIRAFSEAESIEKNFKWSGKKWRKLTRA